MKAFTVKLNITAANEEEAARKAKILMKIGEKVTMSNLDFLGLLSEKTTINNKLSNPLIRTAIKKKL